MNKVTKNKIELLCCCCSGISLKKHGKDTHAIVEPLSFIPFDVIFKNDELAKIADLLLDGSPYLKVTIEKSKVTKHQRHSDKIEEHYKNMMS